MKNSKKLIKKDYTFSNKKQNDKLQNNINEELIAAISIAIAQHIKTRGEE